MSVDQNTRKLMFEGLSEALRHQMQTLFNAGMSSAFVPGSVGTFQSEVQNVASRYDAMVKAMEDAFTTMP
jgi:hypothetical protein